MATLRRTQAETAPGHRDVPARLRPSPVKVSGTIPHAAAILLCLSENVHSLTDIARRCRLSKSTTHRILKLLERPRLVIEDDINRRYYPGPLLKKLAADPTATHRRLIAAALPEMERLADLTEETVALDTLVGFRYISLYELPSPQDLKVTQEGHHVCQLFAGAAVKVLLSQLDDRKLTPILDNVLLRPVTEHTVTDKKLLMAQLDEIRRKGFAVTRGERVPGVMYISAPVTGYFLPLALNVVGPEIRLQPGSKRIVTELMQSADRISALAAAFSA